MYIAGRSTHGLQAFEHLDLAGVIGLWIASRCCRRLRLVTSLCDTYFFALFSHNPTCRRSAAGQTPCCVIVLFCSRLLVVLIRGRRH